MPEIHLALLRGINVGGKNKMAMKDLIGLFADSGGANVRTYIQSGNVIFDADPAVAEAMPARVAVQIAERYGYRTPVVLRTTGELAGMIAANPFLDGPCAPDELHAYFLAEAPDPARLATLDPDRSPPDRFAVRGREIYLCLPDGMARTKLTNAYFDARLATTSTGRNWRTITKLLELMRG